MNAIAALGRRVIERVQGIGVATLMLLQILFSMPDLAWRKAVYLSDVSGWGIVPADYCGFWPVYWCRAWFADV